MIAIRRVSKNQPAPLHRPESEASAVGIRLNRLNNLGTVSRVNVRGADSVITAPRPVRFGILCDGPMLRAWQAQSIEELLRIPGVNPALIIFSDEGSSQPVRPRGPPEEPFLLRAYLGPHPPRALRRVDMTAVFQHIPSSTCRVRKQDGGERVFEDSDVRDIRGYELDFLLQFGSGILGGEILQAARYGVWSFHHSGEGPFRGVATCFWPIYNGDPITGTMLQRIRDRLAGGIVLRSGTFRTALHSLRQTIDDVYFGAARWPASVCQDIRLRHTAYLEGPPSATQVSESPLPSNVQMMQLIVRQTRHAIRRAQRALTRHEEWCIGIVDAPISTFLDPNTEKPVRWLHPPGDGRFIADPFGAQLDGAVHILYEDFRYSTSKGLIATMEGTATGPPAMPKVAIELPVPASYPYLVEDRDEIYCVPETNEAREVRLYRAVNFPTEWEKVATILTGVAALDSTLFRHEGRWWLTHTDREAGQYVHLFVWHAANLEGPWEPHALNPVKADVRSSRPAGTPFVHQGTLYRPAQDCSRRYGGRIVINRVSRLSPTEFAEEPAAIVEPFPDSPFPDGIHTISRVGDVTLVDSKRHRFIPSAIPYVLRYR